MIYFIIGILLISIAAASEAVMDKVQFHYKKTFFSNPSFNQLFWNPSLSWENKWKEDLKTEKFPGSSTIFVFSTDAWHCFKTIRNICLFVGLPIICLSSFNIILNIIVARIIYGLVFTLFFDKVLLK